jgi:hypothetical protein
VVWRPGVNTEGFVITESVVFGVYVAKSYAFFTTGLEIMGDRTFLVIVTAGAVASLIGEMLLTVFTISGVLVNVDIGFAVSTFVAVAVNGVMVFVIFVGDIVLARVIVGVRVGFARVFRVVTAFVVTGELATVLYRYCAPACPMVDGVVRVFPIWVVTGDTVLLKFVDATSIAWLTVPDAPV